MMPETTSNPWELRVRMPSRIGTIMLWSLCIAFNASGSGVSMPQNTVTKNASRIFSRISGRLAMFSVASQASRIT